MLPRGWGRRRRGIRTEIHPDEILIDSSNLPAFDRDQFEGRIEQPLSRRSLLWVGTVIALLFAAYAVRAGNLQIVHGTAYAQQAQNNQLEQRTVFADRGEIVDRTGRELADNVRSSVTDDFAARVYATYRGLAHAVGYVKAPAKDSSGSYYRDSFLGVDGAEHAFDTVLAGRNGTNLTETDAHGVVVSQSIEEPPQSGEKVTLSLDAEVTQGLYDAIAHVAGASKFQGGAGVLIDVQTGELLAITSYPEFSQTALEQGDAAAIKTYNANPQQPFLNRAVGGLYAPGSIVKPIMAVAALNLGVIDENKQLLSTGSISVPNPYDAAHPSVFKDWRANGWVDVRQAIAVSSDVYFYEVGGGFETQPGIGIDNIGRYLRMFGFGTSTDLKGFSESDGTIPSPAWKEENFPGDPWRIGDTYHTAIGQYGVQVTPLQAARATAAVANGGMLLTPSLLASSTPVGTTLSSIDPHVWQVVREGMRLGVTDGIAQSVKFDFVKVAAKTGTAQVGMHNEYLNSWMIGFWPYEHPRYAYAVVLERGPAGTLVGAPSAMGAFLQWMNQNEPQYVK